MTQITSRSLFIVILALALTLIAPFAVSAQDVIACGDSVTGSIDNANFDDLYVFTAEAGDTVTFDMESTDGLDTYLNLLDDKGEILASDDDGGEGFNSSLSYTFDVAGDYVIQATRFGQENGGSQGSYTLSVSCGDECGWVITDTLMGEAMEFEYEAMAGETLLFDLVSDEFDPLLLILDSAGEQVGYNDDGGEGLNSRLLFTFEEEASYTIVVTSFDPDVRSGEFTLTATCACLSVTDTLTTGTMEFEYEAEAGEAVTIGLTSEEFDTYLRLLDPMGTEIQTDDDGGEGLNSQMEVTFEETGTYTIVVTSFSGSSTGEFTLTVCDQEFSAESEDEFLDSVTCGQTVTGEVTDEQPIVVIVFQATAGQSVTIDLVSADGGLDPYLGLADLDANILAEDDDGGGNLNSRIEYTFTSGGTYYILATRFGFDEGATSGTYNLTVTCR